ncbi:MAG TPA: NADH-quinone oxidoreductase subunit NuoE [Dermatophilaceae bacterium]|nr:NADH-quinone oxidoreductase subunit NuoE [Dermatophilaceae bacterium]
MAHAQPADVLPNYGAAPAPVAAPYSEQVRARLLADAETVIARYPRRRSALLPLLHLVQSEDGYVSTRGIELCAQVLGLTTAEVSGVATFYTQYKRHPNGQYTVGVCTNTLCAIMGGDLIWEAVSDHLGIGHDETTADGMVTLERVECNAACDYAPVVMANWEFFDNQTPESVVRLVDELRAGTPVRPTRGAAQVCTFKQVSRVLAGFPDGRADEGLGAGGASLAGLRVARERGWDGRSVAAAAEATGSDGEPADPADAQPATLGRTSSADTPANAPDEHPAGHRRDDEAERA